MNNTIPFYNKLYVQVVIGIFLGIIVGYLFPDFGASLKPLGLAFIKLIKMIIPPVIFLTIAHGIGSISDFGQFRNIGLKALCYFLILSTCALIFGLLAANILQPGAGMNISLDISHTQSIDKFAKAAQKMSVTDHLMHIIPDTLFSPFVGGEVIQILFVAILFGLALLKVGEQAQKVTNGIAVLLKIVFKIVNMLMRLAPIGAFGAIAYTIGAYGIASMGNLLYLIFSFYITSFLFIVIIIGSMCWWHQLPLWKLIKYFKDEIFLVIGTSSSEPALPSLIEKLKKIGVSEAAAGLIVPMGYSFNLDGINIYMTLAALFIAQALNIDLSLWQQLSILLVAIISSKGAAGVTGAGFVILATTLSTMDTIPVAGMALILGIDRFMSECRAITSFISNAVTAVIVAKSSHELNIEQFNKTFDA